MDRKSLRHKIGSKLMFGFSGNTISDLGVQEILKHIKEYNLGGVILYGHNIHSPEQLKFLTNTLISAKPSLLIAIDQEGGAVARLSSKKGFKTDTPSAKHIATHYNIKQAYDIYSEMAQELSLYGINFNLAPVVDIDKDPPCPVIGKFGRSYGKDPIKVNQYSEEFIEAHNKYGIATAKKHFPGHGLADTDTHKELTDVTYLADPKIELMPYQNMQSHSQTAIMAGHIVNKNLDATATPASLSSQILNDLLRKDLNFSGIVISDEFEMHAIKKNYSLETVLINAINAGVDILLFKKYHQYQFIKTILRGFTQNWNTNPDNIISIIENAISNDTISMETINESYNRIQKFSNLICIDTEKHEQNLDFFAHDDTYLV